ILSTMIRPVMGTAWNLNGRPRADRFPDIRLNPVVGHFVGSSVWFFHRRGVRKVVELRFPQADRSDSIDRAREISLNRVNRRFESVSGKFLDGDAALFAADGSGVKVAFDP